MMPRSFSILLACGLLLGDAGCWNPPGKPKPGAEAERPDQVLDFPTLYAQNCSGCHGDHGTNGAAISLGNPVYLAVAGVSNLHRVTAAGVAGTLMPPFARSAGGMLTDRQILVLAQGMVAAWGRPTEFADQMLPAYAGTSPGDPVQGKQAFTTYCSSCHGANGTGTDEANSQSAQAQKGSLVDPAYLALISDQGLRSLIIAGQPEMGMPGWNSYRMSNQPHALTESEISNIVAWMASHRTPTPGQPYRQQPMQANPAQPPERGAEDR